MKKILCFVLAVVMAASCCALFSFAAEPGTLVLDGEVDVWGADADAGIGYDLTNVSDNPGFFTNTNAGYLAIIVDGCAATGDITIPEFVTFEGDKYRVVAIREAAFTGCVGLKTITLPDFEGFTLVNLSNGTGIANGVFVDCDQEIKIYSYKEQAAVIAYCGLTDDNVTNYPKDIDPDITEDIYSAILKIFRTIIEWFKSLFKLG